METIYILLSIMRNNKKNWEIFSKSVKNNAIVCDHIPTTPALITTTHKEKKMNLIHNDNNIENAVLVLVSAIRENKLPSNYLNDDLILENIMAVHNLTKEQSKTVLKLTNENLKVAQ